MKSVMRKILAFTLFLNMLVMMIPTYAITAYADNISTEEAGREIRLLSVFNAKIDEIKARNGLSALSIAAIKSAYDFAGHEYTVVEFRPSGYMVFDEAHGMFLEYSHTAPSPFAGKTAGLYYCGPTFYFADDADGNARHTVETNNVINASDKPGYAASCNSYFNSLSDMTNTLVLDYLDGEYGNQSFHSVATAVRGDCEIQSTESGRVEYAFFFGSLQQCGYYCPPLQDGICGYIALGMVVAYREYVANDNSYMYNAFWASDTHLSLQEGTLSPAWYIRVNHGGDSNSTISTDIKEASQSYFTEMPANPTHRSLWAGFFTSGTIRNSIDADNPVILFGDMEDGNGVETQSHSVVAYGYYHETSLFGGTEYVTHFGWDGGFNAVVITGTFGSIYILEP